MRIHTLRLLAAASALAWGSTAMAQGSITVPGAEDRTTRVGTRGANFLHVGVGARSQGLAQAGVATIEGPEAMFWNPANIVARENLSGFVSYMKLFGNSGITNTAAAITLPVGQGAFGFALTHYASGDIQRTTENAPNGDDPAFPGSFQWTGTAFNLQYARNITDRLTAAVGARYAQEGIDFARNSYVGADISTRFRTGLYGLTVAAAITNIGGSNRFRGSGVDRSVRAPRDNGFPTGGTIPVQFNTRQVQLPTAFRLGVHSSLLGDAEALFGTNANHTLMAEVDVWDAIDSDIQPSIGVEYGFKKNYFLRGGKRFMNEQNSPWKFADGLSFGGGVRVPFLGRKLTLDYAYTTMGELQHNQVLSFEIGN